MLRYQYKLIAPPILLSALPSSFDSDRSSRTLGELMTGSLVAEAGWEPPNNVDAIKGLGKRDFAGDRRIESSTIGRMRQARRTGGASGGTSQPIH